MNCCMLAESAPTVESLSHQGWSVLVGAVLPLLVAVVTREVTSARAKALLLAALSAVSGFGSEVLAAGDGFDLPTALITWGGTFAAGVLAHFGLYKPASWSTWIQRNIGRT